MRAVLTFVLTLLLVLAGPLATAAGVCSTLYDSHDRLVYRTADALVDLSKPISGQVGRQWPGHHVVLSNDASCPRTGSLPGAAPTIEPLLHAGRPASLPPMLPSGGMPMDGADRRPDDSPMLINVPLWPSDEWFRADVAGGVPPPDAARWAGSIRIGHSWWSRFGH